MLLRRITQHVREQNWFAVIIDFCIVVIGILIAFQITDWNEDRVEAEREIVLLKRLHFDFERIVGWGERNMHWVYEAPGNTSWLIEQIRADRRPEMDDTFKDAAMASIYLFATFEHSPTYQELVSTGTLSRISNPDLRDSLANYGRSRDADKAVTEGLFAVQNSGVMREAIQFQTWEAGGEAFDGLEEVTVPLSFDWEALKETQAHLQVVLQNHLYIRGWKHQTFTEAKKIMILIKKELELSDTSISEGQK